MNMREMVDKVKGMYAARPDVVVPAASFVVGLVIGLLI